MKKILANNKGVISIAVVIGIFVGISVLGFGGYKAVNHFQATGLIKQAEELEVTENYEEAVNLLKQAQAKAFTKGIEEKIDEGLKKYKQLIQDKLIYNQGTGKFDNSNWREAIDLFAKISLNSPLYKNAQDKIDKANEEIEKIRKAEEEKKIKEAEEKAQKAEEKKKIKEAEERTKKEAEIAYQAKLKKEEETKQKVEENDNNSDNNDAIKIEKCKSEYVIHKEQRINEFEKGKFVAYKKAMVEVGKYLYDECVNSMKESISLEAPGIHPSIITEELSFIFQQCDNSVEIQRGVDEFYNEKLSEIEQQLQLEYQQCLSD